MTLTGPYTAAQRHTAIATAARLTGVRLNNAHTNGRRVCFTLRPHSDTFRAWNLDKNRRKAAVCWHGHALFMAYLFRFLPAARLQTCHATYKGARDFLDNYQITGGHDGPLSIGGPAWRYMNQWAYANQCHCWQSRTFVPPVDHTTILRIVEGG